MKFRKICEIKTRENILGGTIKMRRKFKKSKSYKKIEELRKKLVKVVEKI